MNKKIAVWAVVMALVSGPVLNLAAQEGQQENEEVGMMGAPDKPEMQPEMQSEMPPGMVQGRMAARSRKAMHGGGDGGRGVISADKTLAVIRKHDAAFAKKMEALSETAPVKYKILLQLSGKLLGLEAVTKDESLERDAVRAVVLEFESKELSLKYKKSTDADKNTIKESLRGKLAELFDLRAKGQELRVKHMEAEIASLKKNLETRKANKSKIVEQRLEELSGEGSGW